MTIACAGQVNAAGAVLDDDHGIETPQEHSIHVDEIGSENALPCAVVRDADGSCSPICV